MFEFLFHHPRSSFLQADWFFASGWPWQWLAVAIVLVAVITVWSLRGTPISLGRRSVLFTLQVLLIGGLLTLLWKPALRADRVQAGENAVTVLVDTSASMHHADSGASRLDNVEQALRQQQTLSELAEVFTLNTLAVADGVEPVSLESLPPPGSRSRLSQALTETLESAAEQPLAGVVLISDGAETDARSPEWWQSLLGFGVPVFAVAAETEFPQNDLALVDVQLPQTVTTESDVTARIEIRYAEAGTTRLRILDGDRLLVASDIELPVGQTQFSGRVKFNSGEAGLRDLKFELESRANEKNTANNEQRRVLEVQDKKRRILYVEGEPRWEYKFMRRAVHASPAVELVGLLHTSPNKFYRQGVLNADELKDGFPVDRATLFGYDAIIIGSLDAAMLSAEQQENLREFVRVRGGSLLMLGGTSGLGDGGWSRTVVASALPTEFRASEDTFHRVRATTSITELGLKTPWLQFTEDVRENLKRWEELPELADVQQTGRVKPGATVLLRASFDGERLPLLSWQRYGRGKTFVLATGGTWRWQMRLPADDQRHEVFWQGLLGELTTGVLPRVNLQTNQTNYRDDTRLEIEVAARNPEYGDTVANLPIVSVTAPDGSESTVPLQSVPDSPGRYRAVTDAPSSGEYRVAISDSEGDLLQQRWVLREDNAAEDFALYPDTAFLQRLADETGGQYLTLDQLGQLPSLLQQSQSVLLRKEVLPLWNLPAIFLALLFLKLFEYLMRWRWKRL